MLLLLFFTLLLSKYCGNAMPLSLPGEVLGMRAADNEPERQTIIEIILECAKTTFICTWVSVHPNVPPRTTEEYGWKSLWRRLRLMFWALLAPELVLAWSAKQWYVAGEIADIYNEKQGMKTPKIWNTAWSYVKNSWRGKEDAETKAWTRTHGHLVAMGGIVLIEHDMIDNNQTGNSADDAERAKREPTILTLEILKDLIKKDPGFEIDISKQEIEDKAKGDFLSKFIVVLQTTWFIKECIQKTAITELEVVTLALASLNAIMSFFWWNKPLGLAVPIQVRVSKLDRSLVDNRDVEGGFKKALSVFAERYATQVLEIFCHNQGKPFFIRWYFYLLGYALILLYFVVLCPIIFIAGSLYRVMASNSISSGATHVPTFYSPKADSEVIVFRVIFPISGAVFGGLHCLGWTFAFPTKAEQTIWKLGSITITIIPVLYFLTALFAGLTTGDGLSTTWKSRPIKTVLQLVAVAVAIIFVALSWVYLFFRLILLVEAIVLLRRHPFLAVDWTTILKLG